MSRAWSAAAFRSRNYSRRRRSKSRRSERRERGMPNPDAPRMPRLASLAGFGARVARAVDIFEDGAVRVAEIGARSIDNTALPVFLEEDLDAVRTEVVERRLVVVGLEHEGVMDAVVIVEDGIDRAFLLHQDEAVAARVDEGHLAIRRRHHMFAADDIAIELLAALQVADRDAEMRHALDRHHVSLPRPSL